MVSLCQSVTAPPTLPRTLEQPCPLSRTLGQLLSSSLPRIPHTLSCRQREIHVTVTEADGLRNRLGISGDLGVPALHGQ